MLAEGQHVWVRIGKTDHLAKLLMPHPDADGNVLVQWTSNGLVELVPLRSIKKEIDPRKRRRPSDDTHRSTLTRGEEVWVQVGKIEQPAKLLVMPEADGDALVQWTSNGLAELVPLRSIKKQTDPRKRRRLSDDTYQTHFLNRYDIGTPVYKSFEGHGTYYGEIVGKNDEQYIVRYSDGDKETYGHDEAAILEKIIFRAIKKRNLLGIKISKKLQLHWIKARRKQPRKISSFLRRYEIGTPVYKFFEGHGNYQGEIIGVNEEQYIVRYGDGDEETYGRDERKSLKKIVLRAIEEKEPRVISQKNVIDTEVSQETHAIDESSEVKYSNEDNLDTDIYLFSSITNQQDRKEGECDPMEIRVSISEMKCIGNSKIQVQGCADTSSLLVQSSDPKATCSHEKETTCNSQSIKQSYHTDNQEPRRSKRSRVATIVMVNGQPVKTANNYTVEGGSYKYGNTSPVSVITDLSNRKSEKQSRVERSVYGAVSKKRINIQRNLLSRLQPSPSIQSTIERCRESSSGRQAPFTNNPMPDREDTPFSKALSELELYYFC